MKTKRKILFITDSLAYPRSEPEGVAYDDTYVALVKNEFTDCDVIHHGRGGATIEDLFKHASYYHDTLKPDLVFVQSGIVDCAPRALSVIEQHLVSRLPLLNRPLIFLVKRYSGLLRRLRRMTYTPLPAFEAGMARFEAVYPNVYWIAILPASSEYERKLEGITANTERYNQRLCRGKHVPTGDFDPSMIMSDHHHLNRAGHHKMFEAIARVVRQELAVPVPSMAAE